MSVETIIALWKDTRAGLIHEVENIPEDQFSFRPTPDTRSIAELLQHIISAQKILVGETSRQPRRADLTATADDDRRPRPLRGLGPCG